MWKGPTRRRWASVLTASSCFGLSSWSRLCSCGLLVLCLSGESCSIETAGHGKQREGGGERSRELGAPAGEVFVQSARRLFAELVKRVVDVGEAAAHGGERLHAVCPVDVSPEEGRAPAIHGDVVVPQNEVAILLFFGLILLLNLFLLALGARQGDGHCLSALEVPRPQGVPESGRVDSAP